MLPKKNLLTVLALLLFFVSSNVFADDFLLPHNQWRLIALPAEPPSNANTIEKVFGDDISGEYGTTWVLYTYRYPENSYGQPLELTDVLKPGKGYWIVQVTGSPVTLKMPAGSHQVPDTYSVKINSVTGGHQFQWTLAGNPFSSSQALGDFLLKTDSGACATPCDLKTANNNNLFLDQVWTYDRNTQKYAPPITTTNGRLNPWDGFWAASLANSSGHDLSLQKSNGSGGDALVRDFKLPTPLFSAASAWRQDASQAKKQASSDQIIETTYRFLMGDAYRKDDGKGGIKHIYVSEANASMFVEIDEWTVPIFRASNKTTEIDICKYTGYTDNDPKDKKTVAAPAGKIRPSGPKGNEADGALVLFNPANKKSSEFWQATVKRLGTCIDEKDNEHGGGVVSNELLEAGSVALFNTEGEGVSAPGTYSASASGYSHLAGLLLPEDFESGKIMHALKFAIPGVRNLSPDGSEKLSTDYKYPASSTEDRYGAFSPKKTAMVMGTRIRLVKAALHDKQGNVIDENQLSPATRRVLAALREYGAYLADNAGSFQFWAEDSHSGNLKVSDAELASLTGLGENEIAQQKQQGMANWGILLSRISEELAKIPLASGVGTEAKATVTHANFEVVDDASHP